jgi:DNA-binding beta-propeller fold protein YncE
LRKASLFAVLISLMLVLSFVGAVRADSVIATINLSQAAGITTGAVYDPKNGYVYVPYGYNDTAVISGTTLIGNITGGTNIFVVDSSNGYLYGVVGSNPDYVLVVSGTKMIANITVGTTQAGFPCIAEPGAAYDSSNGFVYVTSPTCAGGSVSVINGTSVIATLSPGLVNFDPVVDPSNGYVYVALGDTPGEIAVISGTALLATVTVGEASSGIDSITFDAFNGDMYVECDSSVWVLSGASVAGTISPIRGSLVSPQVDPSNGDLYIATIPSFGPTSAIVAISGTSVVGNITVGNTPLIAFDSENGYLYDSSAYNGSTVSVISGTNIIANVTVGQYPWNPIVDPSNGEVYVTSSHPQYGRPDLWVISGTSLLGVVTAGVDPAPPLYNPSNGYLYVPNEGGAYPIIGSVSVISTSAPFNSTTTSSSSTATTPSSSTTSSTTIQSPTTTQSSSSSSTSGGGGVPVFPYQFVVAALFTIVLAASYLLVRRRISIRGG